jgi:hypothetical protein
MGREWPAASRCTSDLDLTYGGVVIGDEPARLDFGFDLHD